MYIISTVTMYTIKTDEEMAYIYIYIYIKKALACPVNYVALVMIA